MTLDVHCISSRVTWVGITMNELFAGSYTTSINWQSFVLFHSASFANVACSVAECHESIWRT
jgi:hypothetical protein